MESKIDVKGNSATETLQMERISIDCVTYLLSNSEWETQSDNFNTLKQLMPFRLARRTANGRLILKFRNAPLLKTAR